MKIELFIPCFVDQFSPETGFNMVKVLEKAGCKVHYNVEQTCCGHPAFHAGRWEDAREVGEKLLDGVPSDKCLVCGAASCTAMIRNSYDLLFQNSSFHNKYRQLQKKSFELSEFLVEVIKVESFGAVLQARAVYMDSCQAVTHCQILDQPRTLLKNVEGLTLLELNDQQQCCGFGGVFATNFAQLSTSMGEQKLQSIIELGADTIISNDYGCLMHLDGLIKKKGLPIKIMHLADVLASGW